MVDIKFKLDILMKMYLEQTAQARQHEKLRVNFITLVMTAGTMVFAFIGWDGILNRADSASLLFIVVIGIIGFFASCKHYERNRLHVARAKHIRKLMAKIDTSGTISKVNHTMGKVRRANSIANYFWAKKIRLKYIWSIFPLMLSIFASVTFFVAWIKPVTGL